MKLTESQCRAVEHDGSNLQLVACGDSGKTEVVARRVVHLLTPGRPDTLEQKNIIAFTFTSKAAAELKERIVTRTRQALGDLTGRRPDYVEICELDERKRKPRSVDDDFIDDVKTKVRGAAEALRTATLPAPKKCGSCNCRGTCTAGRASFQ